MAVFQSQATFEAPISEMFAFLIQPNNLVRLAPPDMQMTFLTGPDVFELDAILHWEIRRFGIRQQFSMEITELDLDRRIAMKQLKGPFRSWFHAQSFLHMAGKTTVIDQIEFQPPSGIMGLTITESWIKEDLQNSYTFREKCLREIFS